MEIEEKFVKITKEYYFQENVIKEKYHLKFRELSGLGVDDSVFNITLEQMRCLKQEINDLL